MAWCEALLRCAVPRTDEEFRMREYHLNVLHTAFASIDKIEDCLEEVARKDYHILESFLRSCESAASSDLLTRISTTCNALSNAMDSVNKATGM